MSEIVSAVVNAPLPTLFILAGIVFLFIAVVGNVSGKIEPGARGRLMAGVIGVAFIVAGFAINITPKPSPTPPLTENIDEQPAQRKQKKSEETSENNSTSESSRTISPSQPAHMQPEKRQQASAPVTPIESETQRDRMDANHPRLEVTNPFNWTAVIDDLDGYTNVRSMKSSSSNIVTKVYEDEEFYTYQQNGNWWQIRTMDGKIGYMHLSRIRVK